MSKFLNSAKFYQSLDWHIIPILPDSKKPVVEWTPYKNNFATDEELEKWFKANSYSIGLICGQSGLAVIDDDSYKSNGGNLKLASTLTQTTPRGGTHYFYKCPPGLRPSVNEELAVDIRGFDSYVLVAPSKGYKWNVTSELEFLEGLRDLPELPLEYLKKIQPGKKPGERFDINRAFGAKQGSRNAELKSAIPSLIQKHDLKTAWRLTLALNKTFEPPEDIAELKKLFQYEIGWVKKSRSQTNSETVVGSNPVWPLPLDEAAYHGLAGRFVKLVEPHSEADPVFLLTGFLTAFGNIVGNKPYIQVEQTKHRLKLFTLHVGPTGKGRKGVASDRVRLVFDHLDTSWSENIVNGGLATGEGLINAVKDPVTKMKEGVEVTIEDGVKDKRLFIVEPEFSSVLKVMAREHNILSPILRSAWDRGDLRTLTKTSPLKATGTHISVVGHITREDLLRYLNSTEMANGFANRILIFAGKRSKKLAFGGNVPFTEMEQLTNDVFWAVDTAKGFDEITFDEKARELWIKIYNDLTEDVLGIIGSISARLEPYTLRVAGIYALSDASNQIRTEHLRAAVAVIDYYMASLYYLFGNLAGNPLADRIIEVLTDRPEMSKSDLMDYFQRNKSSEEISTALELLEDMGKINSSTEKTSGRNVTIYNLISLNSLPRTAFPKTNYLKKLDGYITKLNSLGTESKDTPYEINEINEKRLTPKEETK